MLLRKQVKIKDGGMGKVKVVKTKKKGGKDVQK